MSCSVQMVRPGVYRARVYIDTVDGQARTKSRTYEAKNLREAKQIADQIAADIRADVQVELKRRGVMNEVIDAWAKHQRGVQRSPATLYRNQSIERRIRERFGAMEARQVTARDVDEFYAELRQVVVRRATADTPVRYMSESTVHHYHRVLRGILRYGVKHDFLDKPVTEKAETPKPIRFDVPLHPDHVMGELFTTAPATIRQAIAIQAFTGLRRGELFGLRWADIRDGVAHVSNNLIVVPKQAPIDRVTKGKRSRRVPIVPVLQTALVGLRAEQEAEAARHGVKLAADARVMANMSVDPTGRTPHNPTWLSDEWTRHCDRHGHHVRLHDLRHWCASQLLRAGVPVNVVQEILGHAEATTTLNTYAHVAHGSLDLARDALAAHTGLLEQRQLGAVSS